MGAAQGAHCSGNTKYLSVNFHKLPLTLTLQFITYGAYDLYPVGSWINNVGRVHGRYLNPILPHEAKTRDEMSTLVRVILTLNW